MLIITQRRLLTIGGGGGSAPTASGQVTIVNSGSTLNATLPVTASAGDEIVLFCASSRLGVDVAATGFTSLLNYDGPVGATTRSAILRKTAAGGETSVAVSQSGNFFAMACVAVVVQGTTGYDAASSDLGANETSANTAAPQVTTPSDDCLVLNGWFQRFDAADTEYPATLLGEGYNGGVGNAQVGVSYETIATAGLSTPLAMTAGSQARRPVSLVFTSV